ncbi:MAG: aminopeptidase, partial [Bacteroidales bacterium]|nr:aminopeptidase [Bacteroidales bacterium]
MKKIIALLVVTLSFQLIISAQTAYKFADVKTLDTTPVKDQHRSGTCWSFSGISFFESELLRLGKGEVDLSEMFVVRNAYADKAKKYVRLHGNLNFAGGGAFNDVSYVMENMGMVP